MKHKHKWKRITNYGKTQVHLCPCGTVRVKELGWHYPDRYRYYYPKKLPLKKLLLQQYTPSSSRPKKK